MSNKKYPVNFVTDYTDQFYGLDKNSKEYKFCKKWKNKSLTINEAESLIDELREIFFDGKTIIVYNDYIK